MIIENVIIVISYALACVVNVIVVMMGIDEHLCATYCRSIDEVAAVAALNERTTKCRKI